jgi:hypothetical protein
MNQSKMLKQVVVMVAVVTSVSLQGRYNEAWHRWQYAPGQEEVLIKNYRVAKEPIAEPLLPTRESKDFSVLVVPGSKYPDRSLNWDLVKQAREDERKSVRALGVMHRIYYRMAVLRQLSDLFPARLQQIAQHEEQEAQRIQAEAVEDVERKKREEGTDSFHGSTYGMTPAPHGRAASVTKKQTPSVRGGAADWWNSQEDES